MDGTFLSGFVRGLTDEIGTRRAETRKREDAELERRQQVLNNLYDGVLKGDVKPEHFAQIVKDQMDVGEALAGPRKRKGTKGFFTGESDLSGPLGGILEQLISGQMDTMEGDEEGVSALPNPGPDMTMPTAPIPEAPASVRALEMPSKPSPFASADMGVPPLDITPQQLPTPFNPPRFVSALQKPGAQQLSMQPPPVPAPPKRQGLLVNPQKRAREQALATAESRRAIGTEDLNAKIRAIEASPLDPEQKAAAIASAYGAPASVGTTQEGGVIPDPASSTGFSQVIWGVRNGKVQETGRIPAPAPKAEGMPASREDMLRDAEAALKIVIPEANYTKPNLGLTGEQLATVEQWRKVNRGTVPQPPRIDMTPMQIYDRTKTAGNDFERFAKDSKTAVQQVNVSRAGYRQLKDQIKAGRAQGPATQALIMSFGKVLDPSSVVRESEYNRSQEMQGLIDKFDSYKQSIMAGGVLSERVADEMMSTIEAVVKSYQDNVRDLAMRTRAQVQSVGGDLRNALTPSTIDMLDVWDAEEALRDDPVYTEVTLNGKAYVKLPNGSVIPKPRGR